MREITQTPLVDHLQGLYSPWRLVGEDIAVSLALQSTIIAGNGLASLCHELRQHELHPRFMPATLRLIDDYEAQAEHGEITTRVSGGVRAALTDMALASEVSVDALALLTDDFFIGPVIYASRYNGMDMAAGDLTVYRY